MASADPFGWVGGVIDGKYRIDAVVGEGGFGVVYRGQHLGFDEPVAVKCLKLQSSMSPPEREAFHRKFLDEGKLLHRLSRATAGIVQALDVGAAVSPSGAWTPYLVLEWLRGTPLDRELAARRAGGHGGLPVAEAIALLAPAARAIEVAHAQGVAHRDVKPANLFLTEIGDRRTLKVLDFGIAKVLSELASTTQAMAETGSSLRAFTPQYGAPEQFHRRFGATGPWTDVFALGLVLIEVASGRVALGGSDTTQLYIASTDPAFRPSLREAGVDAPDAVEAALRRALAVDLRERYRTAGALWDALEAALSGGAAPRGASSPALSTDAGVLPTGEYLAQQAIVRASSGAEERAALGVAGTDVAPAAVSSALAAAPRASSPFVAEPRASSPFVAEPQTSSPLAATPRASSPLAATPLAAAPPVMAPRKGRGVAVAVVAVIVAALGAGAVVLGLGRRGRAPAVAPRAVEPRPRAAAPADMVRVAAGVFTMGSSSGGKTEKPPHLVTLTRAFYLDRTEVTVADYQRCVQAGRCTPSGVHGPRADESDVDKRGPLCTAASPGKGRHPITCVDQSQAVAYCASVGKRLPTEAEWELAARGADGRDYPWGNDAPGCDRAVVSRPQGQGCGAAKGTQEVGSLPGGASAAGALDMAGNTWEWVADGWDPAVYARGAQTDPLVPAAGDKGVLRGGSWDFAASHARSTFRLAFDRGAGDVATGFRCARTAE